MKPSPTDRKKNNKLHTLLAKNISSNEEGAIAAIAAITLIALVILAGVGFDISYGYLQKARMQAFADAAALSCGQHPCEDGSGTSGPNAELFAPLIGPLDMTDVKVTVLTEQACGIDQDPECIEVRVEKKWDTFFGRLFGKTNMGTKVLAVAAPALETTEERELDNLPVILAFGEQASDGVSFNRQNDEGKGIRITGDVISNSPTGIVANTGYEIQDLLIDGNAYFREGASQHVNVGGETLPVPPTVPNPCPAAFPPPVFCDNNSIPCKTVPSCPSSGSGPLVVQPGTYGNLNLNGTCDYKLAPGEYLIKYGMGISMPNNATNTISGDGVTFIFESGANTINITTRKDQHNISLKAPQTGEHAGILMRKDTGPLDIWVSLGGSAASPTLLLDGAIYTPNGQLRVQKDGQANPIMTLGGLVAPKVIVNNYSGGGVELGSPSMPGVCSAVEGWQQSPIVTTGASGPSRLIK